MEMYKIVTRYADGTLRSARVSSLDECGNIVKDGASEHCLKYIPGKATTAKVGGCFVFKEMEDAFDFLALGMNPTTKQRDDRLFGDEEIWLCEVDDPIPCTAIIPCYMPEHFKSHWEGEDHPQKNSKMPAGTLCYRKVTIKNLIITRKVLVNQGS